MASSSRTLLALRTNLRTAIPASRPASRQLLRPAARRSYASGHGHAGQGGGSDLPWLITSVAITVPALAYLMSGKSKPKPAGGGGAHDSGAHTPSGAPISPDDEEPAVEKVSSTSSGGEEGASEGDSGDDNEGKNESKGAQETGTDALPEDGNPTAGQTDATGREVPPPSADNASLAEKWDEKKEGVEEYKEKARAGETKVSSSSSDAPSKKTLTEDPREDPKGGEGEGAQKGGPSE